MAGAASHASFLPPVLTFCAAAVVAVPLFRRLGLSAVLGYLAAGVAIGPSALGLIEDAETTAQVAELGVVLLLFIVGLELKLGHLWSMRRDIFGAGFAQLAICSLVLGSAAYAAGVPSPGYLIIGIALGLSATAIALQMLEERGDLPTPYGQRAFAVLLFQDLSIVPVLAAIPLLGGTDIATESAGVRDLIAVAKALAAIAAVVVIGRYGLNPFFRVLAHSGAREVMTASALLVVLGAALLMQEVGLSMAMGAFLAGLLLAESNFRHQLEADIEPFRGILLGLFFMSVGMSIDLAVVRERWVELLGATLAVLAVKTLVVTIVLRAFGSPWRDGVRAAVLLSPAGEFAFVLLPLAAGFALLDPPMMQFATALAALTMLLGPVAAKLLDMGLERVRTPEPEPEADHFDETESRVLVIGFGRFGQMVNQVLLAQGVSLTVIDRSVERIREAAPFGFRVYYGDGTRVDVLRAAGAAKAEIVCICIDDPAAALKVAEIVHANFPQARTFVRAYDRVHAIDLMKHEVDFQLRELVESAFAFGRATLQELGLSAEDAGAVVDDVRKRDIARLMMQMADGSLLSGADLLHGTRLAPEPLTKPRARSLALSPETRDIIREETL
ncbi:MAG TPA: monovalent cation:proton antiporter-2 (CPA2) family protein [Microvirga sp.]|jgi:monovalent cation:proton antiporter-2 (CPA2) family protein|nr:monovalent cation:proton antiporter-2 (CPA2) family protein [Microvirga sp.]